MVAQFFLLTPLIEDAEAFRPRLDAVLETGVFSVVLLRFKAVNDVRLKQMVPVLRETVQAKGVACLIECPDDPRLIARLELDGAHISQHVALTGAIESLKPTRIIGVGGLRARHDAMELGEKDIDYLMFGEPRADGSLPPLAQTLERAGWWAEVFTVPCVAYAPDMESIAPLAQTGTEFIALGEWLFAGENPAESAVEARRVAMHHARVAG